MALALGVVLAGIVLAYRFWYWRDPEAADAAGAGASRSWRGSWSTSTTWTSSTPAPSSGPYMTPLPLVPRASTPACVDGLVNGVRHVTVGAEPRLATSFDQWVVDGLVNTTRPTPSGG